MSIKLTHAAALAATAGDVLKDDQVKGLELQCKTGGKHWFYYYRFEGTRRRPKLGSFPALQVQGARDAARDIARRVAKGEDPSAERMARREAPTVAHLCAVYLSDPVKLQRKPRTIEEDERNVRNHVLPRLGARRVADVTSEDIAAALLDIAATAPVASNRVRALLHGLFAVAERSSVAWRPRGSNPVSSGDVPRQPERKRRRHATPEEMARIGEAMEAAALVYPDRVAALRCILLCGTRVTELISARKEQRVGNRVTLTEHKTDRTGDDRVLILPEQAAAIIDALPDDGSPWIFGAGPEGTGLTRYHVYTAWRLVQDKAQCEGLTVRDLRRTFATAARSAGVGLDQIGRIFGHRDSATTQRYAWIFDDTETALVQSTADAIAGHMSTKRDYIDTK